MEVEFLEIDNRNAWNSVFQEIKNESNNYSHIILDARKIENKNLNRYRDVNPFDHSRVRLQRGEKDYINASLVKVPSAGRSYILTQGPLRETTGHFWLMVWEQKSKAILMLNRVIEKDTVKCHQYWPLGRQNGGSDDLILQDVNLKISLLSEKHESFYIRKFLITDLETQDSREILQFHYITWPDFGVPESPGAFLNFLFTVRNHGVLNSNVGPPVVHCSAGIGRSGTFCLVDSCLVLIEKYNDSSSINIRQQLLEMRHYRMGLIQTPDQLRFSYLSIIEGAKRVLNNRSSSLSESISSIKEGIPGDDNALNADINTNSDVFSPPPLPPRSVRSSDESSPSKESDDNLSESVNAVKEPVSDASENTISEPTDVEEQESPKSATSCNSPPSSLSENMTELRKRARMERDAKTASIVQNIKNKQKKAECWEKRRSFIKISLGLVLIIGIAFFGYKNYSKD